MLRDIHMFIVPDFVYGGDIQAGESGNKIVGYVLILGVIDKVNQC